MKKYIINFGIFYSINVVLLSMYNNLNTINFKTTNTQILDNITKNVKNMYLWNNQNITKHYWIKDLDEELQNNIEIINNEILTYLGDEYNNLRNMDEIYYSARNNKNSDLSFVNTHTDGPLYYCSVYRGLIVLQGNKNTKTILDSNTQIYNLQKYDILLFDYNNNLHYIKNENIYDDNNDRILIKVHYVKNDKFNCGNININYNKFARDLFNYNKYILNLSGILMLISQMTNSYRVNIMYIYVFLYLLYELKKNKILENLLLSISLIPLLHLYLIFYINYIY